MTIYSFVHCNGRISDCLIVLFKKSTLCIIYHVTLILGPKTRQRFLCELRIATYNYVGAGNSTNKKDAQSNAAKDFVSFLVRQGFVNQNEVPAEVDAAPAPVIHRTFKNLDTF